MALKMDYRNVYDPDFYYSVFPIINTSKLLREVHTLEAKVYIS